MSVRVAALLVVFGLALCGCSRPSAMKVCQTLHDEIEGLGKCVENEAKGPMAMAKSSASAVLPDTEEKVVIYQFDDPEELQRARAGVPALFLGSISIVTGKRVLIFVGPKASSEQLAFLRDRVTSW